jgi:site-specific DNA-cytosine methylase
MEGNSFATVNDGSLFNWIKVARNKPTPTLPASHSVIFHPVIPGQLNEKEYSVCGSYPLDYTVINGVDLKYLIGMSVPPLMVQKISEKVKVNILDKLKVN